MIDIVQLRTLVSVVEEGGFTAAARKLGVAKSLCSRHISDLEKYLGVRLLTRTTRVVKTTEIGERYFEQCRDLVNNFDEVNAKFLGSSTRVAGRLRVTLPHSVGTLAFVDIIYAFVKAHPDVTIELHMSDVYESIHSNGYDMGIRIGELSDSSLVARRIGRTRLMAVASPTYLKRYKAPQEPEDLSDHKCLVYTNVALGRIWEFSKDGKKILKQVHGDIHNNSGIFQAQLVTWGAGIAYLPDFTVRDLLAEGKLVQVLPDWETAERGIYAVYPERRHLLASVRAFIDHLLQYPEFFGQVPENIETVTRKKRKPKNT